MFLFFQDGGQTELNLWNVAGIFYILVAGLILSVVIACFEFIYKSKIDSRRSKVMYIFIFFFSQKQNCYNWKMKE